MPHVVADEADERLVLLRAQLVRVLRRNAPVLSLQRERIGRRAHRCALPIQVTVRPRLGARGIGADGHVAVQPDRHAELARAGLRLAQLVRSEPLQVEEVLDVLCALAREAVDDRRRRIAIVLRPAGPAPVLRPLQPQVPVERIVDRMQPQRIALHFDETAKRPTPLRVVLQMIATETRVQERENLELRGGNADVVDIGGAAQSLQRCLEIRFRDAAARRFALGEIGHVLDRDVEHVEELTVRRTVRTDVRRIRRHERVQRIEADDAAAERCGVTDQLAQIAEIAHAPVARRTQRVELRGDAPHALACSDRRQLITVRRGNDETQLTAEAGVQRDRCSVIAERQIRQSQRDAPICAIFGAALFQHDELVEATRAPALLLAFERNTPLDPGGIEVERNRDRHDQGLADLHDDDRRQQPRPAHGLVMMDRRCGRLLVGGVDADGREDRSLRLQRHLALLRAIVDVCGGDAVELGKFLDGVHPRSGLQREAAHAQRRVTVREQHAGVKRNDTALAGGQALAEVARAPACGVEHHLPHRVGLRRRQAEIHGRVARVA